MPVTRSSQEGFGIVVIALLFTAFSVIMAAMLDRNSVQLEIERQQQVEEQLTRLSIALARHARYTASRFPCPANYTLHPSDYASFGVPVGTNCKTAGYAGVVEFSPTNRIIMGMVPVRALIQFGVSYNDAFDPWGSRIMYVVHRMLTVTASDAEVGTAALERPQVQDYQTTDLMTPDPDFVLISYGRDRMNGRLRTQNPATLPPLACGTGIRGENCNNDRLFYRGPIRIGSRIAPGEYFDDSISALRYLP